MQDSGEMDRCNGQRKVWRGREQTEKKIQTDGALTQQAKVQLKQKQKWDLEF